MPGPLWERFEHDPRRPDNAALRASDKDRDLVQDVLGTAYAEGRLTREELDERADRTNAARTLGELPPLVNDLVATASSAALATTTSERRAAAELKYRQQRQQALGAFLTPSIICWVIYAFTMPGSFPWPIFVTIGAGIRWVQLMTNHADTVASIEHDMEKKERRKLEQRAKEERKGLGPTSQSPEMPEEP